MLAWGTLPPKEPRLWSKKKKKKPFSLSLTAKVDLLCYWWQNSQCGIRTLSSDNVPESQHGAAFTGGGHTLLSVLPWAKPAKELVTNRGTTSGCYCFPYWWRKNIIVQWSLWCCGGRVGVQKCFSLRFWEWVCVDGRWMCFEFLTLSLFQLSTCFWIFALVHPCLHSSHNLHNRNNTTTTFSFQ